MTFVELLNLLSAILIPIALAVVGYFYNYAQTLKADTKEQKAELRSDLEDVRRTLNDWQLTIVSTYATKSEMEKMEMKIMIALEKLDVKLDRVIDRGGHVD